MANYQKITHLFTQAENRFLKVLQQAIGDEYLIYGKIRIADAIKPNHLEKSSEWHTYFNKIKAKHFDFILCDKVTNEIVCAIELNDRTHLKISRVKRDRFVDEICKEINLPLLFIENKKEYEVKEIKKAIYNAVGKSKEELDYKKIESNKDRIFYGKRESKDNFNLIELKGWTAKIVLILTFLTVAGGMVKCSKSVTESSNELKKGIQKLQIVPQKQAIQAPANKDKDTNKISCWQDETGKKIYSNVEPINKSLVPCD